MEKQMNIPQLRFPEFKGEWTRNNFGDIVKINQGLQIPISERFLEQVEDSHFYITNEFLRDNSEKKYFIKNPPKSVICTKDDILMTRTGNTGMVVTNVEGAFHNNFFKIAYPQNVVKGFLYNFLKLPNTQKQIIRLAGTSTIPDLNHSDFYKIEFVFPNPNEQKQIADFVFFIDEKIQALKKKHSLLEQYKKGVMQKLFSQELRFKDEDGNDFSDWSTKKIGDCLDYEQPTNYLVSSTEYSDKFSIPVVTAGKTFILGYTDETSGIFSEGLPVIIFDDFTTASQFVDFPFKAKSSAMKILKAKENADIKFMYEALQMINYETGAHGRHWISVFAEMEILVPDYKEQIKISSFLSAIDKKINSVNTTLLQTENWKKGLLQKMFC